MTNYPFNDFQPRLAAWTEGLSGSALRGHQALMTFLVSTSQAQFNFSRGLAEDMTEAFKTNPATATQTLVKRWHDRSEQAISQFRHINDDLRNDLYEAFEQPLQMASTVAVETTGKAAAMVKPETPVIPAAKAR